MTDFEKMKAYLDEMMKNDAFMTHLGIEFTSVKDTEIIARMPFKKEICNPYGTVHGGVLYSLADITTGVLACAQGYFCTTSNGNLNYLYPAKNTEYVYCRATLLKAGKSLINVRAEITDDAGKLLDEGSFVLFRTGTEVGAI